MAINTLDYNVLPYKKITSPNNKELVTVRANFINKKTVLTFSIGTDICELLDFKKSDRVNIYLHKRDKNVHLIKKSSTINEGYLLSHNNDKSSFMTFTIRYPGQYDFRLSQTIIISYDINDDGCLLLNIEKLKWRK